VGSWSLSCRSHYFIHENQVHWAEDWSDEQIEGGRRRDRLRKDNYYPKLSPLGASTPSAVSHNGKKPAGWAWLSKLKHWITGRFDKK
jgi:hypothetical protein